jgi:hypothetical protein
MGALLVPLTMSTALCMARHEIRSAWRDGRFLAGAGVVLLLLSIALAADHHVRWREFFVARITIESPCSPSHPSPGCW